VKQIACFIVLCDCVQAHFYMRNAFSVEVNAVSILAKIIMLKIYNIEYFVASRQVVEIETIPRTGLVNKYGTFCVSS